MHFPGPLPHLTQHHPCQSRPHSLYRSARQTDCWSRSYIRQTDSFQTCRGAEPCLCTTLHSSGWSLIRSPHSTSQPLEHGSRFRRDWKEHTQCWRRRARSAALAASTWSLCRGVERDVGLVAAAESTHARTPAQRHTLPTPARSARHPPPRRGRLVVHTVQRIPLLLRSDCHQKPRSQEETPCTRSQTLRGSSNRVLCPASKAQPE